MKKFDNEVHECNPTTGFLGNKEQYIYKFPNNYGASVIRGYGTFGSKEGLFELAVLRWKGNTSELCYETEITDDVLGYLNDEEVAKTLDEIKQLEDK